MFRVLINQHYQHRTNQKLRLGRKQFFKIVGFGGKHFFLFPPPSFPFFFCSRPNVLDKLAQKCLLRRLDQYSWPLRPKEEGCFLALQKLRLLHCLDDHVETAINCSREQCFVLKALTCLLYLFL